MASSTKYYGLGFFDFGDPLGVDFAGQVEIDRFVFIDKMLYGLMSIFGNGVVNGWTVSAEIALTLSVNEGTGNINFQAARTTFPTTISELPVNSTNYVYAKLTQKTRFTEDVEFVLETTADIADPNFLILARVITGSSSITSIDNSVRQEVGFIELIKAAIRLHKHRGGSLNPSKIDLESEVRGQLPSFRIANFDADKVTSGTFDLSRMPLINHQNLQNVGLLTHPQLDTFIKTLESTNKEIFGEITTSNLLQLILAMKFVHDDPDSIFYLSASDIDENMINTLAVIPGITPDTNIDFDNTTAIVDLSQHSINGVAPVTGNSFFVNYDTALAWNAAFLLDDVLISGDTVTLGFNQEDETSIVTIEGFESATAAGQDLSGGDLSLFTRETLILTDDAAITSNISDPNKIEGFYSGEFTHQQTFRVQYVKEFDSDQDWSTFDTFILHVKCMAEVHGSVNLFFEDSAGNKSIDYIILDANEITSNLDSSANDFKQFDILLATVPFREKIRKFVIYTDDIETNFSFFIDFINIQRAILLPEDGSLVLRYASGAKVTFSTIEWESIEPSGTSITVRARAADGTVLLNRATYTPLLTNGSSLNLEGTDLEIEIVFTPDIARVVAPVLISLRILLTSEAETDGFLIDSADEFGRGTGKNIVVTTAPSLQLDTPIYVNSYYYILSNLITQKNPNTDEVPDDMALFASDSPIAPNTIFNAVEKGTHQAGARFFEPRSVRRQNGRTFVVADTYNDRILEYDEDGVLIAGFGSINYSHTSKVFPLSASLDVRTGILYIVWSRTVSFKTVDVGQISLHATSPPQNIRLIKDFDKILGLTTSELDQSNTEGQIMPIHLSTQNAGLAQTLPSNNEASIIIPNAAISTGVQLESHFFKRIVKNNGRIPLYVGNFAYIDGVFSPTWCDKTDEGAFVVTNGKIAVKEWDFPDENFGDDDPEEISLNGGGGIASVSSIIEVNSNNLITFGSNIMDFSPFIPGRADKVSDNTLLIGGLRPGGTLGDPEIDGAFNFRSVSGNSVNRNSQKSILNEMFFTKADTPFTGAVILYDIRSNATTFEYTSAEGVLVSDVDIDPVSGEYVVAESSFDKSGRIIKLDAVGNIVFSFGEGLYGLINSVAVQVDSSIVVST